MAVECDAFCDLPSSRVMDQTMTRYNDRSAFANNGAQDAFVMMQMHFLAAAQNQLEQHGLAQMILQMRGTVNQPGNPV